MSNDNQPRKPKGSPEAGQWTQGQNAEAGDISLTSTMNDEEFFTKTKMTPQEVLTACQKLGYKFAQRSPHLDPEELAGQTMEEIMRAINSDKEIKDARAYLKTKAHGKAVHGIAGTSRGPDITALGTFLTRKGEWEEEHSTEMPDSMRDKLADSIRTEMKEAGKQAPTINFHRRALIQSNLSLDAMTTDEDGRTRDHIATDAVVGAAEGMNEHDSQQHLKSTATIQAFLEASDHKSAPERRAALEKTYTQAFEVLSEGNEAVPSPVVKDMSNAEAKASAQVIEKSGGPYAVAQRIVDGSAKDHEVRAFMTPFGRESIASSSAQQATAEVFVSAGQKATETMWPALHRQASGAKTRQVGASKWSPQQRGDFQRAVKGHVLSSSRSLLTPPRRDEEGNPVKRTEEEMQRIRALMAPWAREDEATRRAAVVKMARFLNEESAQRFWVNALNREGGFSA